MNTTPLMVQYKRIKEEYPDTILLFRVGDFFETFEDDAKTASKILGITLTKRANGKAGKVPLAGFPHHAIDTYLPKLVHAGFRVAVCEQMENPKYAKGIVKRDVVEVVTPGVAFSDKLLDHKKNNYLAAIFLDKGIAGISFCDISTGELQRIIAKTGMKAVVWEAYCSTGTCPVEEESRDRRRKAIMCLASFVLFAAGFLYHVMAGRFSAGLLEGASGWAQYPGFSKAAFLAAVITGGRYIFPKAFYAIRFLKTGLPHVIDQTFCDCCRPPTRPANETFSPVTTSPAM